MAAAVQLAGLAGTAVGASSSLTVQLPALQVLLRMARVSKQAAAAIMLFRQQVLDGLMTVVLGAGTTMPATAPTSSTKSKPTGQDTKAVSVAASALTVCEPHKLICSIHVLGCCRQGSASFNGVGSVGTSGSVSGPCGLTVLKAFGSTAQES